MQPRQLYYYFNGQQVGDVGNEGPSDLDYGALQRRQNLIPKAHNPFTWGRQPYASFGAEYDPINGQSSASRYVVQTGDTLQSIASGAWGDASLWYLLAEANGLNGSEPLIAGQTLTLPGNVYSVHNSSETFRVYDPNKAMGDVQPSQIKPTGDNGCGATGQILMVIVAIVVMIVAWEAAPVLADFFAGVFGGSQVAVGATAIAQAGTVAVGATAQVAGAVAAGAVIGAGASVVNQAVAVAVGAQEEFSWNAVAMGAISGAVTAGLSEIPQVNGFFNSFGPLAGAARGLAGNALSQGVALSTGLQSRFDWTSLAVAGVVSGVSGLVGAGLGRFATSPSGRMAVDVAAGIAGGVAGAGARSVLTGTDFGDNLRAVLPDVIASTIGNAILAGAAQLASKDVGTWAKDGQDPTGDLVDEAMASTYSTGEAVGTSFSVGSQSISNDDTQPDKSSLTAEIEQGGGVRDEENVVMPVSEEDNLLILAAWSPTARNIHSQRLRAQARGIYEPRIQLEDSEYEKGLNYTIQTNNGQYINETVFPEAGKYLEIFIRNFEPKFKPVYPATLRPVAREIYWGSVNPSDGRYTAEYVSYLAEYAANTYDNLTVSLMRPPPLYERTSTEAKSFTIADAAGRRATAILLRPRGTDGGQARAVLLPRSGSPPGAIGRSRFQSWDAFAKALLGAYQAGYEKGDARWASLSPEERAATSKRHPNTQKGSFLDEAGRAAAREFVRSEGLREGPKESVQIGRRLYNQARTQYVMPDVYVPAAGFLADGSVSRKTLSLNRGQLRNMQTFSGTNSIIVVRPSTLGGSYPLIGPGHNWNAMNRPTTAPPPRSPASQPPPVVVQRTR